MAIETKHGLFQSLYRSKILSEQQIADLKQDLSSIDEPKILARILVDRKLLSDWQAQYLLSGKSRLRFANYVLYERLRSDDRGDVFVAFQENLQRYVKLQFLNPDLSRQLLQNKPLLRQVAQVADISYPHLEQLHLIEHESDHLMLVTDYFPGKTLTDPELLVRLQIDDLHAIITQLLEAMAQAHKRNLTHGQLTEKELVYDLHGNLYVTDLFMTFLMANLQQRTEFPERDQLVFEVDADIQSIYAIGKRLANRLERVKTNDSGNNVQQILDRVGSGHLSLLGAADEIRKLENYAGDRRKKRSLAGPIRSDRAETAKPQDRQIQTVAIKAKHQQLPATRPPRGRKKPTRIPIKNLITVVLMAVVAVAAVGYFLHNHDQLADLIGTSTTSNLGETAQELPSLEFRNSTVSTKQDEPVSNRPLDESGDDDLRPASRLSLPNMNAAHSETTPLDPVETSSNHQVDHQARDFGSTQPQPLAKKSIPDDLADVASAENSESKKHGDPNEKLDTNLSILEMFHSISQTPDEPNLANEKSHLADQSAPTDPASLREDKPNSNREFEKSNIPPFVGLPPTDQTEAVSLFSLPQSSDPIDFQLIRGPEIARSKIEFVVDKLRKQTWRVGLRTSNLEVVSIAEFHVLPDHFTFQWSSEAKKQKLAGYLANCLGNLKLDGSDYFFQLRTPITIPELVIPRQDGGIRQALQGLEFLPNQPVAELHPLDFEVHGPIFLPDDRANQTFSHNDSLVIHFKESPDNQLLYLELIADLKNRPGLEANLRLKSDSKSKHPVASQEAIEEWKQQIESQVAVLKNDIEILGTTKIAELRARFRLSAEQFKDADRRARVRELKQQLAVLEIAATSLREILTQLESIYDWPLPVSVYFELQGHRVLLATTEIQEPNTRPSR